MTLQAWPPRAILLTWLIWCLGFGALLWGSLLVELWRAARASSEIFLVMSPMSWVFNALLLFGPPILFTWRWYHVRHR